MPPEPGSIFAGKYHVESTIGVGGMSTVYSAINIALEQRVALKVLQPELARHEELVQRFVREAKAAAKISGEHVVKVFDVGTSDGVPFIVLEVLSGLDLGQLVATRGPMIERDAVDAVIQACHAIAQAHAVGVVHRDLKPSNLFLATADDGSTAVKVLDFGISKLIEPGNDVQVTRTRDVFGSPAYMSPEQLRASRDVDARSDIWSLGVVLFELLTGAAPFEGASPMAVGGAILHEEPIPLRAFLRSAPEALEQIIATCLRKDANERYATVAGLVNALAPFASSRGQALIPKIARVSERNLGDSRLDSLAPRTSGAPSSGSLPAPLESAPTFLIGGSQATNGNWAARAQRSGGSPRRTLAVMVGGLLFGVGLAAVVLASIQRSHVSRPEPPASPTLTSEPSSQPIVSPVPLTTAAPMSTETTAPSAVPSPVTKPFRGRRPATTASVASPRTTPAATTPTPTVAPPPSPPAATADRVRDRHGMDE